MSFDEFLAKRGYIRGYRHDYQVSFDYGYEAGQQSKQQEIDRLKAIIAEALAVYDRPMCDETALYQRDDDIWHILTEDKFI